MLNYDKCPSESCRDTFHDYIDHGYQPGSFTRALLCNDLKMACAHADSINKHLIFELVEWMWNELPAIAWGSPEAYEAWLKRFQ